MQYLYREIKSHHEIDLALVIIDRWQSLLLAKTRSGGGESVKSGTYPPKISTSTTAQLMLKEQVQRSAADKPNQQPAMSVEADRPSDPTQLLTLVVDTITLHITGLSEQFDQFRSIRSAIENDGDHLTAKVISGGCTNFSYKVSLQNQPDVALFAKLCFPYALWNPDPDGKYD